MFTRKLDTRSSWDSAKAVAGDDGMGSITMVL